MKFKTPFLCFVFFFIICSCGQDPTEKNETQTQEVVKEEVEMMDSLSVELDKAANEIEKTTKELEDALKVLENL